MLAVKIPKSKSKYGFSFLYYDAKEGRPIECRIIKDGELFVNGVATTYYTDIYNKRFGRKIALKHALKSAKFSRKIRTVFWKVFLEKCLLW
jgi:hypothetical protein